MDRNGLDGYLRVPMSVESFEVPLDLKVAIEKLVKSFKGVDKTDPNLIREFLTELRKHEKLLAQYVPGEQIVSECFEQF